jgi:hypothetical protein
MTRAEIELLEECKIQLMHIHDVCKRKPFYTTKNLIKNIEAAISDTRCCETFYCDVFEGKGGYKCEKQCDICKELIKNK